ncbi:hypothetical protein V5799_020213 [Amblyomma americanum]|uniref:Uncharacterized protein n=1 Tax=Amblyomma americanum TaxID=6943 RepID=A0AAQ4EVD5_AMBAM
MRVDHFSFMFLAWHTTECHGRALTSYQQRTTEDEAYVVDTLKDIGRTLKEKFLVIGNQIQNKTQELKEAAGKHAQQIKEQLKGLGEQLTKSRDALAKKLFELFSPAKYSEDSGNIFQTLASLATLREKLQKFLTEVHSATGEKWEKLKVLIHELRSEIRQKVQELLHGSSAPVAYSALDVYEEDEDDDEAYVVETLKNISRSLKDQFLVIGNRIQNKTQELKQAAGEHAQQIKEQLKGLGEQLKKSRDALAKKLFELFSPAKYSEYSGNIFQTLASLATLREKLQKFLTEVHSATGEKWEKLKLLIHELRSEIRQKVQELLHGSSAPVAYSALDVYEEDEDDDEAYVVETLKNISRSLKDQFLVIGNRIQNKTQELKQAAGEHAQQIKEQLKGLGEQLKKSRDALAKKLFELFSPAKYSEYSGNIFQTLASLATLREKLQKFLTEVHSATGEKWEKLKLLIHELRSEIRQKVQELLHGSSAPVAYSALDVYEEDEDDDEAYVVETLKNISRSLKDQFLVIGNRIQNKTQELKQAAGEHAQQIKEQLKGLGEQLKKSRDALAKKLFELFSPAKYSEYSGNIFQTLASLATLREKLQKFLTEVHSATGEKWEKLKLLIHELRSEIRQKVQELLHGSSAPVAYSALDVYEGDEDDDEAYVVETLKNIRKSLKDQFLVIGNHIQNKTQELKQAVGEHAQQIKEQLKGLGEQLKKSRDALAKKLFELFSPAKYSEYSGNIFQTLASLATLREKLQKFLTEVHSATGEKWEKLKVLIHELRSEIRQKVHELLHGSSAPVAYSALDVYEEDEDDDEAYFVETLKNISRSLKDQFLVIGNRIQNKTQELKQAAGEHAQQIKEQLKGLGEQLKKSRDVLAKKLFELFSPAKYSEYSGNIFQTLASLATLREKLQKFLTEVHSATGEKWEKLKLLIHELRSEIRQKVQELLHGSSAPVAYSALDVYEGDEDDDEAYVVETLKNIRKSLKDQFLVIGNHIQNKTQELKQAVGEHAQQIKEQLKGLGEQLKKSRDALAKKLFELFSPAKYSEYSGNIFQTLASLATLREKLQKFLTEVHSATGEKWEKLKLLIHELRSEIRQKVQELLHGSSAPVAYSALDVYEEDEDDDEAYVVETLKNIRKSLKDQFLVIGNRIQNKTQELKQAAGEHAQQIKEQLKGLGEQLKKSRDALAKKLFELFSPAKYSEYSGNIFQTLASLATLREKLQKFLTEVHSATGEKWEKLKLLIHELRSEIRQKVQELLHGSSAPVAYSALDVYEEDEDDDEAYVVETLKNIRKSLKDQFLVIGNHIQNKTQELKQAVGEHAQQIKEQLKGLGEQLKKSRDALAKKLFELFSPAKYSEYSGNIFQTLASLATLREKLQKFLTEVHSATGEKWEKLKLLIHELRSEIRQKVQELLHGSSAPVAYSALDVYEEDEDDDEAYVVETLKNISRSLKDQFLVIGNHIQNKTQELKQAVGEHAQQIKEQLKGLGEQLKKSRDALAKKLFELFSPAKYSEYSGNIFQTLASLATLREKLQKFLTEVHSATGEKWEKLKLLIHELRSEIRQKVQELLHGSSAPVAYSALDVYEEDEDDDEAYVVETLKNISRSLKDQFLVIGNHIQNKTQELKQAVGEHAQQIKEQLKGLGEQLKKSRDALAKKLFELFSPAKYSEYSGNIFQTLASLATLREKLQKFLTEVHSATGEKWEKLKVLIHELRSEIRQKVQELLHGSSAPVAYSALDVYEEDEDDDEAYVVETLKNIRKSLKDQFLVIGNRIQNKTQELKQAVGEHAQQIKEQLKGLGEQLKKSRDALAKKLFELFSPAKYSEDRGNIFQTLASLATLREKLQKFLTEVHSATGEKWEKLKALIHELRSEIRQKVQELFVQKSGTALYAHSDEDTAEPTSPVAQRALSLATRMFSLRWRLAVLQKELEEGGEEKWNDVKGKIDRLRKEIRYQTELYFNRTKPFPAFYYASDENEEDMYVLDTLKGVAHTLKEKFLVLGEKIKAKVAELRVTVGERAVVVQEQLNELYLQLQQARAQLKKQLFDLFRPSQYASFKENAVTIYEQLGVLREKLRKFLEDIKNLSGEKWERAKVTIAELRQEIREKVQELLGGGKKGPASYSAEDSASKKSLADSLKDAATTLKEKFQVLGKKIQAKVAELRGAVGEHAVTIKQQLESLKAKFNKAHSDLMTKLFDIFKVAQYDALDGAQNEQQQLSQLELKLEQLLCMTGASPAEAWPSLEGVVSELLQEIEAYLKKHE